jgi:hypothetical protein
MEVAARSRCHVISVVLTVSHLLPGVVEDCARAEVHPLTCPVAVRSRWPELDSSKKTGGLLDPETLPSRPAAAFWRRRVGCYDPQHGGDLWSLLDSISLHKLQF